MGDSQTLKTVLEGAKAGDSDSFRTAYMLLSSKVFRFIRPRMRNRDEALDILQETFVDFWRGLPRFVYQSDAATDAYLYRIADRKIKRSRRWWSRFISIEDYSADDMFIDQSEPNREDIIDVTRALHVLGEADRQILVLRHIQGYSFSEISQFLGANENTLKVRHHRAMRRLRHKLKE